MFARIAAFEIGDVDSAERMLESTRERASQIVEDLEGWQGALQLLDREAGKVLVIHLFDSEANMNAAEPTFEEMPRRLGEEVMQRIAGRRVSVERYEVLAETRR